MKKLNKGHYGYLQRRKNGLLIRFLILAAGIAILLILGVIVTGDKLNLLTVAACVTAIPAANQLVVLLAVWKFHSRPEEEYQKVKEAAGNGILDTELMVTSKNEKTMEIDYALVHEKGVFCYTSDRTLDEKKTADYLKSFLTANEISADVFVFKDLKRFLNRLNTLEPSDRNTCEEKLLKQEGVLRAIAL